LTLRDPLRILTTHLVVALVALVVIGGATRVMEAGLACPDWPLCYGVLLPGRQMNAQVFLEWFHRLDAFVVGMALLTLFAWSVIRRQHLPPWFPWGTGLALVLVVLQGMLGALTVTGLLASSTVTAHLATALVLLLLISALDQRLIPSALAPVPPPWWLPVPVLATALLLGQCILGGAMASQWAVDHCFQSAEQCEWVMWHRQLAGLTAFGVVLMAGLALFTPAFDHRLRWMAGVAAILVGLQVGLGLLTLHVQLHQPGLTIAHQLVAALLVAQLGALCGRTWHLWSQRSRFSSFEVSCG
jgi:cytochrome c oxidase assembly protein subunit 15